MSGGVRVREIHARSAPELEAKLRRLEDNGLATMLTMSMAGALGNGWYWIICREKEPVISNAWEVDPR